MAEKSPLAGLYMPADETYLQGQGGSTRLDAYGCLRGGLRMWTMAYTHRAIALGGLAHARQRDAPDEVGVIAVKAIRALKSLPYPLVTSNVLMDPASQQ